MLVEAVVYHLYFAPLSWESMVLIVLLTLASLSVFLTPDFAWFIVFVWIIEETSGIYESTSFAIPLMAGLIVLGSRGTVQGVLAVAISSTVFFPDLVRGGTQGLSISTIMILIAFFLLSAGTGIVWGIHRRRAEIKRQALQRSYRFNALRMADQLHNSVANDLVYLSHLVDGAGSNLTSGTVEQAHETIASALGKLHHVIDELSDESFTAMDGQQWSSAQTSLKQLIDSQDSKLHKAGFTGISLVDGRTDLTWMNRRTKEAIGILLEELYGNILKHALMRAGYSITVTDNGRTLSITAADTPNNPDKQIGREGGTGIKRCRQLVDELQGTIKIQENETTWMMNIIIPHPNN
jgi:two-component sensor histidine kinase